MKKLISFIPVLIFFMANRIFAGVDYLPSGELQFHGTVVSRPCDISTDSEDQVIKMRSVFVKMLYKYHHSSPEPFSIKLLNCKTDVFKTVEITFSGTEDPNLPGHLAISGEAAGVGLALLDASGAAIALGSPVTRTLNEGNNQLDFSAFLEVQPKALEDKSITEGQFSAVANFTLSYL